MKLFKISLIFASLINIGTASSMQLPAIQLESDHTYSISRLDSARDYPAVEKILMENYSTLVDPNYKIFNYSESEKEKRMREKLQDSRFTYLIIRNNQNTVCGFIGYRSSFSDKNVIFIDSLGVKQEYKNKGYGKKLIEHIVNETRTQGYDRISLYPSKEAIPFYQKLGFIQQEKYNPTGEWLKQI